jgi:uncharacterized protein YifN (PemK superfamily)
MGMVDEQIQELRVLDQTEFWLEMQLIKTVGVDRIQTVKDLAKIRVCLEIL